MECRGAIHCAHLGSRGIPQGAMNCAPTPCAYLKGIALKALPAAPLHPRPYGYGNLLFCFCLLGLMLFGRNELRPYGYCFAFCDWV